MTPKYTADPQWVQGVSSLAIPVGPSCLSVDFQDGHWPLFFFLHQDLLTQLVGPCLLSLHVFTVRPDSLA